MAIRNQIQFRRGSSTEWVAISGGDGPALSYGEPGFDVTNNILKIGDGSSSWKDLKAIGADQSLYKVKNTSGGIIYKGQVVRANGTVGNSDAIQVTLFIADGSVPEYTIMGLATQDMNNNDFGYVTAFGQIREIDTDPNNLSTNICAAGETWIDGDVLYASASASGKLTKNIPQHETIVAIVLNAADNGSLFVRPTWYPHLSDLHDVNTSGVTNNQYLRYDSSSDTWLPTSSGIFNALSVSNDDGSSISLIDPDIDIYANEVLKLDGETSILLNSTATTSKVGIATAFPDATLDVAGDIKAEQIDIISNVSGATLLNIEGTNGNLFSVVDNMSGSLMSVNDITGLPAFEVFSDHSVVAGRFNSNDFVISSGGNVGIGTATPQYKLDVIDNGRIGRLVFASGLGAVSNTDQIFTPNQLDFYADNSRSYSMTSSAFTVRDTRRLDFRDSSSYIQNTNGTGGDLKIYALNKMTLEGGNVGIGASSPSTKLDVSGVITASGGNSNNWNTAYGWGDHASAGYLSATGGTITNNLTIGGNLTVNGDTVVANVSSMEIEDPILTLGLASGNIITDDSYDRGIAMVTNNGTAFMGWDNSADKFVLLSSGVATNSSGNYDAGTYGDLVLNKIYGPSNDAYIQLNYANSNRMDFNGTDIYYNGTSYFSGNSYLTRLGSATSTASQKNSYQLILQNALWNGSSQQFFTSSIQSIASTTENLKSRIAFNTHNESDNTQIERVSILSNGNVGIGTTDPAAKLDIRTSGVPGLVVQTSNSQNTFQYLKFDGNNLLRASFDGSNFHHYLGARLYYNIGTNGVTFDGGGGTNQASVGFTNRAYIALNSSSTSAPGNANIHAGPTAYATSTNTLTSISPFAFTTWAWNGSNGYSINSHGYMQQVQNSTTAGDARLSIVRGSDNSELFTISYLTSNVGIGTTIPQSGFKLDIAGSTVVRGNVLSNGDISEFDNSRYKLSAGAASNSYSYVSNGNGARFGVGFVAPSGKLSVNGGTSIGANYNVVPPTDGLIVEGNVGIGTTIPSTKLHVNGSALIGKTFFSNTVYSYGNGILIATNLPYNSNAMCELTIEGNSYDNNKGPIFSKVQFYNVTTGAIISTSAISTDKNFSIDIFHYNGYVYLWFAPTSASQTYTFKFVDSFNGSIIDGISNAAKPTSGVTNSVTITPQKIWTGFNDGASSGLDADLLDGQHGSYYQPLLTNPVTGTGTSGYISKWNGTTTQNDSLIYDNGSRVSIGSTSSSLNANFNVSLASGASIAIGTNGQAGSNSSPYYMDLLFQGYNHINKARIRSQDAQVNTNKSSLTLSVKNTAGALTDIMTLVDDNVGIGITDPDEKLEVNGNIHLAANGTLYFGAIGINTVLADDNASNRTYLLARNNIFDILNAAGSTWTTTLRTGIIAGGPSATNNLVLKSTTGVGTTDYISLAVGNNGATEAVRVINNGNVGIGTSTPGGNLSVIGSASAGQVGVHINNTATNGYSVIRLGTDSVAGSVLNIHGFNSSWSGTGAYAPNAANFNNVTGALTLSASNASGSIQFYTAGTGSANERMRITNTGSVGIGTSSPSELLTVYGDNKYLYLQAQNTSGSAGIKFGNTAIRQQIYIEGTSHDLVFDSNDGGISESIRIGYTTGAVTINEQGLASADFRVEGDTDANLLFVDASTNRVGIGTSQPSDKFNVVGDISAGYLDLLQGSFIAYGDVGQPVLYIDGFSGGSARIATNSSSDRQIRIENDSLTKTLGLYVEGNVGIGTDTPSYKLQVNGSFGATTKSFRIDHPSRPNYTLEYGSLESPYHGVRLTGRGTVIKGSGVVSLPYYLKDLIHDDETINIQITNIKHGKTIYVDEIDLNNDQFTVRVDRAKTLGTLEFFWTFTGTRKDVDKLVVEKEK